MIRNRYSTSLMVFGSTVPQSLFSPSFETQRTSSHLMKLSCLRPCFCGSPPAGGPSPPPPPPCPGVRPQALDPDVHTIQEQLALIVPQRQLDHLLVRLARFGGDP